MESKGHKHHEIQLKNLRENERVLHNCSSHFTYHIKIHLLYLLGLTIPLGIIMLSPLAKETTAWFLYSCFGLTLTTYYFIKGVNFELGGCIITNQRVLRFGYTGLFQKVEREILPRNIEDFKIIKRGLSSILFGTANIYFYTANQQTDILRFIIEPDRVSEAYATMMKSIGSYEYDQRITSPAPSQNTVVTNIQQSQPLSTPTEVPNREELR
ncbi:MAG: hypothetical protein OEY44_01280 [Candidatus Peregrinibacteria bacterium]|nr:hypothetical protein [Candidatus Peregrinibacteria bacterium]